jgi:hypothetical protein
MVAALELDLEGFTEDAQGVVVSVQRPVDDRGDEAFGVVVEERLFEDAFAGARFAEHQTESALLGVDAEDVEDFLLVGQQRDGLGVEGLALEAEVGADHMIYAGVEGSRFSGLRSLATGSRSLASPIRSPL